MNTQNVTKVLLLLIASLILFSCGASIDEKFIAKKVGLESYKEDFDIEDFSYEMVEDKEKAQDNGLSEGFYTINFKLILKAKEDRYQRSDDLRNKVIAAFKEKGYRFYPPSSRFGYDDKKYHCAEKVYSKGQKITLEGYIRAVHYAAEAELVLSELEGEKLAKFEKKLESHRKKINNKYGGDIELKSVRFTEHLKDTQPLSKLTSPILAADQNDAGFASALKDFEDVKKQEEEKVLAEKNRLEGFRKFLSEKAYIGTLSYRSHFQKIKIEGYKEDPNFNTQRIKISFIDDPKHYYEFEGKAKGGKTSRYYYSKFEGTLKSAQLAKSSSHVVVKEIVDHVKKYKAKTDITLKFNSDEVEVTGTFDHYSYKINVKEMK